MEILNLWESAPGLCEETPVIKVFAPENKKSDAAVVIYPGGGYCKRATHEGDGYAEFLNANGITAFVVEYRVYPHLFPLPQLDARRGVRFARANAEKYGIDKNKIAVMGSSAGGHLAATTATYTKPLEFEGMDKTDNEDYMPNAQILCYPVIVQPDGDGIAHKGSYKHLLGGCDVGMETALNPAKNVTEKTPPAFIWHTAADGGVNVINSYTYAAVLRKYNVPCEMHIFPEGRHGLGLAQSVPHTAQWSALLISWFKNLGWL